MEKYVATFGISLTMVAGEVKTTDGKIKLYFESDCYELAYGFAEDLGSILSGIEWVTVDLVEDNNEPATRAVSTSL